MHSLLRKKIKRKNHKLGMTLWWIGRDMAVVRVWWGLNPGVSVHPMLNHWSIFQPVLSMRGWGPSDSMRFLLGISILEGCLCDVFFGEFWGIWVAERVREVLWF